MARIDYISENDNDLRIVNGDFQQGDCTDFQCKIIIYSDKGELRQYPLLGASINRFIGSNIDENILNNIISTELESDKFVLEDSEIIIGNSSVEININVH